MKTSLFRLSAVPLLLAAALGFGCAHEQNAAQSNNSAALTGSYIPQEVQRSGAVTNGKDDVRVIDRSDIENSGGADVRQSLRELGVH